MLGNLVDPQLDLLGHSFAMIYHRRLTIAR